MVTQTPSHAADPICYFHCLDRRGGVFLNLWLVKEGGGCQPILVQNMPAEFLQTCAGTLYVKD
jgi:hypothetical protein